MKHSPAAWDRLRAKVQTATAELSDSELLLRTAQLQRRWKDHKRSATFDVLQELHSEQHRRNWA